MTECKKVAQQELVSCMQTLSVPELCHRGGNLCASLSLSVLICLLFVAVVQIKKENIFSSRGKREERLIHGEVIN